jgi:hypothetical protein
MVIRSTYENDPLPAPPHVAHIKIGRYIGPEVPYMARTVGIREPAGHQQRLITHQYDFDDDDINKIMRWPKN